MLSRSLSFLHRHSTNSFRVCTLNIRSLFNPLKFTAISDIAEFRHIDLFAKLGSLLFLLVLNSWMPLHLVLLFLASLANLKPPSVTLSAVVLRFLFVSQLLLFLHPLKDSSHLKCLLLLLNSSVLTQCLSSTSYYYKES